MLSTDRLTAMKAIKDEFQELNSNPICNIGVSVGLVDEDNIFEWRATISGPTDTSYSGGLFILSLKFPENYPQKPPEICFITPIYHININPKVPNMKGGESLGHVCISTLNWWKPTNKVREALTDIFALFYMANPKSPYGLERADEFLKNRPLYEEKAKYFTKKYANPNISDRKYNKDWDFTYKKHKK